MPPVLSKEVLHSELLGKLESLQEQNARNVKKSRAKKKAEEQKAKELQQAKEMFDVIQGLFPEEEEKEIKRLQQVAEEKAKAKQERALEMTRARVKRYRYRHNRALLL